MSESFTKSTKELSKCIAAQEQMQKSARDFLVSQTQWAAAFKQWADVDSNANIKDVYGETAPIWASWSAVQAEHIAQVRSVVYYEMGVLMGAAHDYMSATKETDKARTGLKKMTDKAGKGNPKVDGAIPGLKEALAKAKINEARSRDRFSRLKQAVVKSMLQTLSSSYIRMGEHCAHLFEALYNCADLLTENGDGSAKDPQFLTDCKAYVDDAVATLPDSKFTGRYPGIFLHKKAEKFGKEKKRFFQLEKSSVQGSCLFCYYQDVLRGEPFDRKGEIVIDKQTEVGSNGREILLKNPDRKWVLVAKTPDEARWWSGLLQKSKLGMPEHAQMIPCNVPESDITDIEDARLRLDTVNRNSAAFDSKVVVKKGAATTMAAVKEARDDVFVLNSDFASEEGEGTLNLFVGDSVIVGEKGDDWWFVASMDNEQDGWCPAAFLDPSTGGDQDAPVDALVDQPQETPEAPLPTYVTGIDAENMLPRADEPDPTQPNWDDPPPQDEPAQEDEVAEGRWMRAAYDNAGEEEDELSFNEGDEIWQIQETDEYGWARGILNGKEGIYPSAYVEDIE